MDKMDEKEMGKIALRLVEMNINERQIMLNRQEFKKEINEISKKIAIPVDKLNTFFGILLYKAVDRMVT